MQSNWKIYMIRRFSSRVLHRDQDASRGVQSYFTLIPEMLLKLLMASCYCVLLNLIDSLKYQ